MVTRFKPSQIASISSDFAQAITHQLTTICPITGLVVVNDFPPYPGAVVAAKHPIVDEALALLLLPPEYLESLSNLQAAGLALATLHKLNKVVLKDTSLIIVRRLEATCTGGQLLVLLKYIRDKFLKPSRCYPKLELSRDLDQYTIDSYIKLCTKIENYWGSLEWQQADKKEVEAPAFLIDSVDSKRLNKACYEAWLEVATFLPTSLKEKAKPYIKQLASITNSGLVEKLVASVVAQANKDYDLIEQDAEACLAAMEFKAAVEKARKQAEGLGLYRDILDFPAEIPEEPIGSTHIIKADTGEVVEATPISTTKKMTFAERMAAIRAKRA